MNNKATLAVVVPPGMARANKFLKRTTRLLFSVAVMGQWAFAFYIVAFYWVSVYTGELENWNAAMFNGLMEGDLLGNIALFVHIFLAAVITFGGPLQFIPKIRSRFPTFHRWNGRVYITTALLISLAGLYMVHSRGVIGGAIMAIGNTINASMIIIFSIMTWRTAVARKFAAHQLWAMRTFLVVSGVWFFRIGFGIWIFVNNFDAPGSTEDLTGPFDRFLAFAHALLPLALFESYRWLKKRSGAGGRWAISAAMIALTLLLTAGIFMAAMIFWMPHLGG